MKENETLLDRAEANYNAAVILQNNRNGDDIYLNIIGYHLQQAVELSMKYQMEQSGIEYPKTHDIDQLIRISREQGADITLTEYIEEQAFRMNT